MLGKVLALGLLACLASAGKGIAPCEQFPACVPSPEQAAQSAAAARDLAGQMAEDAPGNVAILGAWLARTAGEVTAASRDFSQGLLAGQQATVEVLARSAEALGTLADAAAAEQRHRVRDALGAACGCDPDHPEELAADARQRAMDELGLVCTCDPIVLPFTIEEACSPGTGEGRAQLLAKADPLRRGVLNAGLGAGSDPMGSAGWTLAAAAGAPSTALAVTGCLAAL
ncbi:MAG TPA: hypothetical protein VGR28_13055 [Candidatus Thermoplasmatota archaeon]|jgi:hypothetical protein|nr:hypothetical protein [Candidatus Thermoplasmatota archaeon]